MKIIGNLKIGDLFGLLNLIERKNPDADVEVTHKDGLLDIKLVKRGDQNDVPE